MAMGAVMANVIRPEVVHLNRRFFRISYDHFAAAHLARSPQPDSGVPAGLRVVPAAHPARRTARRRARAVEPRPRAHARHLASPGPERLRPASRGGVLRDAQGRRDIRGAVAVAPGAAAAAGGAAHRGTRGGAPAVPAAGLGRDAGAIPDRPARSALLPHRDLVAARGPRRAAHPREGAAVRRPAGLCAAAGADRAVRQVVPWRALRAFAGAGDERLAAGPRHRDARAAGPGRGSVGRGSRLLARAPRPAGAQVHRRPGPRRRRRPRRGGRRAARAQGAGGVRRAVAPVPARRDG